MKFLKIIWEDIQRGENIDLYITVPIALVAALLNLFGVISTTIITTITLAVLGVLSISALSNRYVLKNIQIKPSVNNIFIENFPSELEKEFEIAADLWLVGVRLTRPVNAYYSMLEQKLRSGHSVKVLLVDPDPSVVEFTEMRTYTRSNIERTCTEIKGSLADYCELKKIAPERLSIRTIRHPLGHGFIGVNPDSRAGSLYISNYPYKTPGGSLPKYILHSSDGHWYNLYRKELNNLWDAGIEWSCSKGNG